MANERKTEEEYRQEARAALTRREESWERSDTDGFLSQWANGLAAQEANRKADIVRDGGKASFTGLYHGSRRVAAKIIDTKFGTCWLLREDEERRFGRKFIPLGKSSRVQKKLGLTERPERASAWACIKGSGTGLSGNCWIATFRTGDEWGLDAEPSEQQIK